MRGGRRFRAYQSKNPVGLLIRFANFSKEIMPNKNLTKNQEVRRKPGTINSVHADEPIPRLHDRIQCKVPVHIYDRTLQKIVSATVYNFSSCGMYLESEYALKKGSGVTIQMDNFAIGAAKPADIPAYHSQIIWLKKVSGNVVYACYGIGIKHCLNIDEFLSLFGL